MIELGQEVKDKITGYTGIVDARTEFLHEANQYRVQTDQLDSCKPVSPCWFYEGRLEIIEKGILGERCGFLHTKE